MAQLLVDGSQSTVFGETFPSQLLSASGNGVGVDLSGASANEIMAILSVNTVTGFTSLSIQLQQSPDNSTWTNITGLLNTPAVLLVTAASTQVQIPFQTNVPATTSLSSARYVRGVATLVGTSCQMYCDIVFTKKYDQQAGYINQPPTI